MSTISILGFGEANTCAEIKFETLSEEIDRWLGVHLKVSKTARQGDSPIQLWTALDTHGRGDSPRAYLGDLLRLAGAVSVEPDARGFHVVWPGATSWRVVVAELNPAFASGEKLSLLRVVEEASGSCLVAATIRMFTHISQEDVRRATDIKRRNRLLKRNGGVEFTADEAFVEDLKLRVLRVLQHALEQAPIAQFLKSMGIPTTSATDEELLSDGPSLGQDEEHFLAALDADLHSHWQAVAQ